MGGRLRIALTAALSVVAVGSFASSAWAIEKGEPLVASDYFAVQVPFSLYGVEPEHLGKFKEVLSDVRRTGIRNVRASIAWAEMEPAAPVNGTHSYVFENLDRLFALAAREGIRINPILGFPPFWARINDPGCGAGTSALAPNSLYLADWQAFVAAFVDRYGRGGEFWAQNPGLKALPVSVYEIFNEPNLREFWCPASDPQAYADFLLRAAAAINELDRGSTVVTGGIAKGGDFSPGSGSLSPRAFFKQMFSSEPSLKKKIDAVGIHPYDFTKSMTSFYKGLAALRGDLRKAKVPDRIPLMVTEIGWPQGFGYSTKLRTRSHRDAIAGIPRSNCNVIGVNFFSWLTQPNPSYIFSSLNLADYETREPLPIVKKIKKGIAVVRGEGAVRPQVKARFDCRGMPPVDRDGDGIPDQRDPAPTHR